MVTARASGAFQVSLNVEPCCSTSAERNGLALGTSTPAGEVAYAICRLALKHRTDSRFMGASPSRPESRSPHYTKVWKIVGTSRVNLPRIFRETGGANCTAALLNQAIFGKGS